MMSGCSVGLNLRSSCSRMTCSAASRSVLRVKANPLTLRSTLSSPSSSFTPFYSPSSSCSFSSLSNSFTPRSLSSSITQFRRFRSSVSSVSVSSTFTRLFASAASSSSSSSSSLSSSSVALSEEEQQQLSAEREVMQFDVVIVGAGPAGLGAAIRLKQLANEKKLDLSVCVIEKGAEVGSHILSGNVFDPHALNELFPDWRSREDVPIKTQVTDDRLFFLTSSSALPLPSASLIHNHGNFIISLADLTRWLATQAEQLGVEIFSGFAASEVLYADDTKTKVVGIATADVGVGKDGRPRSHFARGIELRAAQTLFAEGVRGSLSEKLIEQFQLRSGRDVQTYGLGLKEVWEVDPDVNSNNKGKKGSVMHTVGWPNPSPSDTWMGTFMYHIEDNKIMCGMVVGLDYANPHLSPYGEFQKWKTHPHIRKFLEGGKVISYGARCINEGGLQSIPKLTFPGGALIGCSAGFLNVAKIKGSHTALKSGMVAAESLFQEYEAGQHSVGASSSSSKEAEGATGEGATAAFASIAGKEMAQYEANMQKSWVYDELRQVRNVHPCFKYGGFYPWAVYSAFILFISKGREPFTLHNSVPDHKKTKPAKECKVLTYPKADGKLTFDLLTNLQKSGVHHAEDQRPHLRVKQDKLDVPLNVSLAKYNGPEGRFCPARVYEYVEEDGGKQRLQINFSNCVHCKTCAIKTPELFIDWTVPEGGGGPKYGSM